ncbi:hypothetical protein [Saguinine gammaherpesvirus 1]|uniref:Uncharacterized protein n=1 Tax=Saguinine gammaherpesvirus 1 TaxID=2169901 RepID=A0A9Q8VIT3_9GAMA|nr:hypothetical protein [Saguinine gammaherpesvirus 1]
MASFKHEFSVCRPEKLTPFLFSRGQLHQIMAFFILFLLGTLLPTCLSLNAEIKGDYRGVNCSHDGPEGGTYSFYVNGTTPITNRDPHLLLGPDSSPGNYSCVYYPKNCSSLSCMYSSLNSVPWPPHWGTNITANASGVFCSHGGPGPGSFLFVVNGTKSVQYGSRNHLPLKTPGNTGNYSCKFYPTRCSGTNCILRGNWVWWPPSHPNGPSSPPTKPTMTSRVTSGNVVTSQVTSGTQKSPWTTNSTLTTSGPSPWTTNSTPTTSGPTTVKTETVGHIYHRSMTRGPSQTRPTATNVTSDTSLNESITAGMFTESTPFRRTGISGTSVFLICITVFIVFLLAVLGYLLIRHFCLALRLGGNDDQVLLEMR